MPEIAVFIAQIGMLFRLFRKIEVYESGEMRLIFRICYINVNEE